MIPPGPSLPFPLTDNGILHRGQHVVVVARTRDNALAAARLLEIDYEAAAMQASRRLDVFSLARLAMRP
jgi:CO/xanthine dehydrogenase Mo-binding subunit